MTRLYVPMYGNGKFAVGRGSSTQSHVRAFRERKSAERSAVRLPDHGEIYVMDFVSMDKVNDAIIGVNNRMVLYGVGAATYREINSVLERLRNGL